MQVVYTPAHLEHDPAQEFESGGFQAPFEIPRRAEIIRQALADDATFSWVEPDWWPTDHIEAVHDRGLVDFLERAWRDYQVAHGPTREVLPDVFGMASIRDGMGEGRMPAPISAQLGTYAFEMTTPICEGTFRAARGAVDVALTTTQLVLDGDRSAYGLCRPPGHHAPRSLYGGYCFFNNAAIAANYAASSTGTRVTVLDVDYHHGNGTQQIFYARDDVQFVSLHGDPARAYPYFTGHADETGTGRGSGCNVNLPLAAGTDDDDFTEALARACDDIAEFGPSLLVVSLGMDTFGGDPIADFAVTIDGFRRCGEIVGGLELPTVVLQEGGYAVDALGANVRQWLLGLRSAHA